MISTNMGLDLFPTVLMPTLGAFAGWNVVDLRAAHARFGPAGAPLLWRGLASGANRIRDLLVRAHMSAAGLRLLNDTYGFTTADACVALCRACENGNLATAQLLASQFGYNWAALR